MKGGWEAAAVGGRRCWRAQVPPGCQERQNGVRCPRWRWSTAMQKRQPRPGWAERPHDTSAGNMNRLSLSATIAMRTKAA
jgi:hypothetical protein